MTKYNNKHHWVNKLLYKLSVLAIVFIQTQNFCIKSFQKFFWLFLILGRNHMKWVATPKLWCNKTFPFFQPEPKK